MEDQKSNEAETVNANGGDLSSLHPLACSAHSWPEDYSDENGAYESRCIQCETPFLGHKDRLICKVCDGENRKKYDAMTDEEKREANRRLAEAVRDVFGRQNAEDTREAGQTLKTRGNQ